MPQLQVQPIHFITMSLQRVAGLYLPKWLRCLYLGQDIISDSPFSSSMFTRFTKSYQQVKLYGIGNVVEMCTGLNLTCQLFPLPEPSLATSLYWFLLATALIGDKKYLNINVDMRVYRYHFEHRQGYLTGRNRLRNVESTQVQSTSMIPPLCQG